MSEENIIIKMKYETEAAKRANKKYRDNHKDLCNQRALAYYNNHKDDEIFRAKIRERSRKQYTILKQKKETDNEVREKVKTRNRDNYLKRKTLQEK